MRATGVEPSRGARNSARGGRKPSLEERMLGGSVTLTTGVAAPRSSSWGWGWRHSFSLRGVASCDCGVAPRRVRGCPLAAPCCWEGRGVPGPGLLEGGGGERPLRADDFLSSNPSLGFCHGGGWHDTH